MKLGIFKKEEDVQDIVFGSEFAACFDIRAYLPADRPVAFRSRMNQQFNKVVNAKGELILHPDERVLVPTGLQFDIPEGYSLRLQSRSGIAWKEGIMITNGEGIIDADYVHEVFVSMVNYTNVPFVITNGERICQADLQKVLDIEVVVLDNAPSQKTSRDGGFGHTGKE